MYMDVYVCFSSPFETKTWRFPRAWLFSESTKNKKTYTHIHAERSLCIHSEKLKARLFAFSGAWFSLLFIQNEHVIHFTIAHVHCVCLSMVLHSWDIRCNVCFLLSFFFTLFVCCCKYSSHFVFTLLCITWFCVCSKANI